MVIKHLTQLIKIQPAGSIENYTAPAQRYKESGKPQKAIGMLYKAIDIFPEDYEKICCVHYCVNKEISQKHYNILKTKLDR